MSKKIAIDAQCLQGPAALRGIGQYALGFISELAKRAGVNLTLVLNGALPFPTELDALRGNALTLNFQAFDQTKEEKIRDINTDLYACSLQERGISRLHLMSYFEHESAGLVYPRIPVISEKIRVSVTNHDLIPIIFADEYLRDKNYKRFFENRTYELRLAHCVLHNSDQTLSDYLRFCQPRADQTNAVIYGGPSNFVSKNGRNAFSKITYSEPLKVFYPSGPDWRKNNLYAISVVREVRERSGLNVELVLLNGPDDLSTHNRHWLTKKRSVSEAELCALYRDADLIFFPSLYEGLGMPMLDAMWMQKKVVASAGLPLSNLLPSAKLFDPTSVSSGADCVLHHLRRSSEKYLRYSDELPSWKRTIDISMKYWFSK